MSINSITQTYDGSFWLGSDNGLIRFDTDTDDYRIYDRSDGLLNNNVNRNSFFNEQNTLYFGTIGGINFFNPIDIPLNESLPKVTFQKLKISNNELSISKNSPLYKSLNQLDTLILKHNQSSFSIDYMGVGHTRSEKNSYAYMLEGLKKIGTMLAIREQQIIQILNQVDMFLVLKQLIMTDIGQKNQKIFS